mmetsp:Transcript_68885/g.114477  ORF Transcript_68885/g.114477 Transcript_68885/m.114477 type:complete len:211 (-) Transcript_68885:342-974(-)
MISSVNRLPSTTLVINWSVSGSRHLSGNSSQRAQKSTRPTSAGASAKEIEVSYAPAESSRSKEASSLKFMFSVRHASTWIVRSRDPMCRVHSSQRHISNVSVSTLPVSVTSQRLQPSIISLTAATSAESTSLQSVQLRSITTGRSGRSSAAICNTSLVRPSTTCCRARLGVSNASLARSFASSSSSCRDRGTLRSRPSSRCGVSSVATSA